MSQNINILSFRYGRSDSFIELNPVDFIIENMFIISNKLEFNQKYGDPIPNVLKKFYIRYQYSNGDIYNYEIGEKGGKIDLGCDFLINSENKINSSMTHIQFAHLDEVEVSMDSNYLCILTIFKNEAHIMKEWLDHYIWQGVQHFFMINNESDRELWPDTNFREILALYENKITLIEFPGKNIQVQAYDFVWKEVIRRKYRWTLVADLDEFIFGKDRSLDFTNLIKSDQRSLDFTNLAETNQRSLGFTNLIQFGQRFLDFTNLIKSDQRSTEDNQRSLDFTNLTKTDQRSLDSTNLTKIDQRSLDSTNLTKTHGSTNLAEIDQRSFDSTNLIEPDQRSFDSTNLTETDQRSFDSTNLTETDQRSFDSTNLTEDDQRSFDSTNLTEIDQRSLDSLSAKSDQRSFDSLSAKSDQRSLDSLSAESDQRSLDSLSAEDDQRSLDFIYFAETSGSSNLINLAKIDQRSLDSTNLIEIDQRSLDSTNLAKIDQRSLDSTNLAEIDQRSLDSTNLAEIDQRSLDSTNLIEIDQRSLDSTNLAEIDQRSLDSTNLTETNSSSNFAKSNQKSLGSRILIKLLRSYELADTGSVLKEIFVNWSLFGSSGHISQPREVRRSFTMRDRKLHDLNKYFFRNDASFSHLQCHACIGYGNGIFIWDNYNFQLNHYHIQSLEFYREIKMKRGDALWASRNDNYRTEQSFYELDNVSNNFKDRLLIQLMDRDNMN